MTRQDLTFQSPERYKFGILLNKSFLQVRTAHFQLGNGCVILLWHILEVQLNISTIPFLFIQSIFTHKNCALSPVT